MTYNRFPYSLKNCLSEILTIYYIQIPKEHIRKRQEKCIGNPVTIYKSAEAMGAVYAAEWRGYKWAGVESEIGRSGFGVFRTAGKRKRIAKLKDVIANRLRCSAFSFDEESLAKYYKAINNFKPHYFYGYVSMIEAFSKYLLKHNLKLDFQLKCVISTSRYSLVSQKTI